MLSAARETRVRQAYGLIRATPASFVAATGVDALAVAVGSSHAMTQRSAQLDQELIKTLAAALPVPLVLHGSSGIADADLRTAAANGIVKINIGTLLNVAYNSDSRQPRCRRRPGRSSEAPASRA